MTYLFNKHTVDKPRYAIVPRPYQHDALDGCYRIWDSGVRGALMRMFTGAGKTLNSAMVADRWMQRGDDWKVMVVSYEKHLVWQFAQEIEDVLGIVPGIEMESQELDRFSIPQIVVASRQTLMNHSLISVEQRALLHQHGISDEQIGLCTFRLGKRLARLIKQEAPIDVIESELDEWNQDYRCDHESGRVSRLHKFDWRDNWLVCFDEAHKFAYNKVTTGNIVDWFEKNGNHRRLGMTATPKRSDGVSLGSKMFPGIAIDYPLVTIDGPCGVNDGYAIPYIQKYIKVQSVDFKQIRELAGTSQKKWDAEIAKRLETELASLCEPMLDLVEDRKTLIFSPSVAMARNVADYINARAKCRCVCGKCQWHPPSRIGDGAKCKACGHFITQDNIIATPEYQAMALWGEIPPDDRKDVYVAHHANSFQFLSVCGLCREGHNDPGLGAIAIFRPVSRKASALAEQMKGRGCRPERGCIDGLDTAEERKEAIAHSGCPNCLVIDLTGVTGLGDCATTVQIYAEGEEDEVVKRAEEIVHGGVEDVAEAVKQAKEEVAEEREQRRKEREAREEAAREAARQRARAQAEVEYTTHDVGHGASTDPTRATEKQLKFIRHLGMELIGFEPSKRQAGRIITMLMEGNSPDEVAYSNGIKAERWEPVSLSQKQRWALQRCGVYPDPGMTPYVASKMIDRLKNGGIEPSNEVLDRIAKANTQTELDSISAELKPLWNRYSEQERAEIRRVGKQRRELLEMDF